MKHWLRTTALAAALFTLGSGIASAETVIKVAYGNNPGEPVDVVMNYWKDLLAERSDGEIKLELYPSALLGSKLDVTEQAMLGDNVLTISDVGFLADYVPDLGILFGPYLAENASQLFEIYESDWYKEKEKELAEKGIHVVISNYLYGPRHLLTTKPVRTIEDMKGLKIRTPNNIMQIRAIEAMGGTATPMAFGEVYTALSQGIIDGVENPLAVLYGQKFHEEAKYLTLIDYLQNTSLFIGGEAYFQTLDPETVALLHETGKEAGVYSQQLSVEADSTMIEKFKAEGVEIIEPDIAPFREAAKAVYTQFPEWSDGLYEKIQAELNK